MRLTDDELRDVLARAEEIQRATRRGEMAAELEAVIGAAEEIGLARPAVERALRERLDLSPAPPAPGSLAFAKSADGKYYVAEVLSNSPDRVQVRFLRGGEHLLLPDEVRPCSFIPGERITCDWPWWGPWTCTVVAYDAASRFVEVSDGWGSSETFPIADVWVEPPQKPDVAMRARRRVSMMLMGAGAGVGALLGSVVTALLMR